MRYLALQLEWALVQMPKADSLLVEDIVRSKPHFVRRFEKYGYEIRHEMWRLKGDPKSSEVEVKAAYNFDGDFIGRSDEAYYLCVKRGILPEKADKNDSVCSIGFCEQEQKWYGWSHRAIHGFKVGDVQTKGSAGAQYLKPGFKAKTLADAKKMAIAFARGVS